MKKLESSLTNTRLTGNFQDDLPTSLLPVASSPKINEQPLTKSNHTGESTGVEEIVDDLPTMPLVVSLPETPSVLRTSLSSATANGNGARHDEIEEISTRPLVALRQWQSISPTAGNPGQQHSQAWQASVGPVHGPALQGPVTPVPLPQPHLPNAQVSRQTPPASMPFSPLARSKRNSRKPLVLVVVLLFVLLLGGVLAWLIIFQPFAVPEITKTTQTFQNADLGVSLQYPMQWSAEVHKQNGTIYFYDDNHTDQVNVTIVATDGQSIAQFVNKEVGSLGMTGQKTKAALSFAGASWQQVQGSVQESGASYTATLLVTMHGGRYYAILQLAPSSAYTREDQLVFSKMRSSFQFL